MKKNRRLDNKLKLAGPRCQSKSRDSVKRKSTQKSSDARIQERKSCHGGFRAGSGRKVGVPNKANSELRKILDTEIDYTKLIQFYYRSALHGNVKAFKILMEYRYGKAPQPLLDLGSIEPPQVIVYKVPAFNYGPATPDLSGSK